jgi:hypothetical protein
VLHWGFAFLKFNQQNENSKAQQSFSCKSVNANYREKPRDKEECTSQLKK